MGTRPLFDECPTSNLDLTMNIIAWNCRGTLKPNFQSHVHDLVRIHNPAIFVVTETRVGGDHAKEITDRLPFSGTICLDTILALLVGFGSYGTQTEWRSMLLPPLSKKSM